MSVGVKVVGVKVVGVREGYGVGDEVGRGDGELVGKSVEMAGVGGAVGDGVAGQVSPNLDASVATAPTPIEAVPARVDSRLLRIVTRAMDAHASAAVAAAPVARRAAVDARVGGRVGAARRRCAARRNFLITTQGLLLVLPLAGPLGPSA